MLINKTGKIIDDEIFKAICNGYTIEFAQGDENKGKRGNGDGFIDI